MRAGARVGLSEEEPKVELPSEKEDKEDLFIFKAWEMAEERITFRNAQEMTKW